MIPTYLHENDYHDHGYSLILGDAYALLCSGIILRVVIYFYFAFQKIQQFPTITTTLLSKQLAMVIFQQINNICVTEPALPVMK